MGQCEWRHTEPVNFITGGFNSPSRLHVEEVRRDHKGATGESPFNFCSLKHKLVLQAYLYMFMYNNVGIIKVSY